MGATKTFERERMKEIRVKEVNKRNAYWESLTTAQKIASLDSKLGVGKGARRQRAKLSN